MFSSISFSSDTDYKTKVSDYVNGFAWGSGERNGIQHVEDHKSYNNNFYNRIDSLNQDLSNVNFDIYDNAFNKIDKIVPYVRGSGYCCMQFILNYSNIIMSADSLTFSWMHV